jgi:hypothetical protein
MFDKFTFFCIKWLRTGIKFFNYYLMICLCNNLFTAILGFLFMVILHTGISYQILNKATKGKYSELINELYNKTLIQSNTESTANDILKIHDEYAWLELICFFVITCVLEAIEYFNMVGA